MLKAFVGIASDQGLAVFQPERDETMSYVERALRAGRNSVCFWAVLDDAEAWCVQALAAWACGFEGARGGMYESDKAQFEREVAALLGEATGANITGGGRRAAAQGGAACLCPSCEQPDRAARPRKAGARAGN